MKGSIYFKGLNGIRSIASLLVVIYHTDQHSNLFDLKQHDFSLTNMAGNAVDMFFVLSGFLITYLLFLEKERTGTINFKSFYIRRVLRIWPLYYLVIIITLTLIYFGIIPSLPNLSKSIFLYVFMMANIAFILKLSISPITPIWSVGVEEQFYLIWPHIIKRTTRYLSVFIILFIAFISIKLLFYNIFTPNSIPYKFLIYTRLNIMCLGAIGAFLVFTKHKLLILLFKRETQLVAWTMLIISIVYKPIHLFSFIDAEINSLAYLVIILNISANKNTLISLENNFTNFIGKISYGIYVYHMIIIYVISYFSIPLNIKLNHVTLFPTILLSTVFISWISYTYFESPFLKLKNKHTIIKSTNLRNPSSTNNT